MILIKKDGFWERSKKKIRRVKKSSVLSCLKETVEIEDGVTLLDLFRIVGKHKLLKLFISQYSNCPALEEFHAQAEEPMRNENDEYPLDYLEVYWHGGVQKDNIYTSASFHGISTPRDPENAYVDGTAPIGISYSPMWELADVPLKLNTQIKIWGKRNSKTLKQEIVFEGQKQFTLLDVLDAIYDDISFMGGPQENAEFIDSMNSLVEDLKSGVVKGIPLKDVLQKLEEQGMRGTEELGDQFDNIEIEGLPIVLAPQVVEFFGLNPDDFEQVDPSEPKENLEN